MTGKIICGTIAILIGIIAVVNLIGDAELVVSAISLTFGIAALIWIVKARESLPRKSSLKGLTVHFLYTTVFVLCFSFWSMGVKMLALKDVYGDIIVFPQYLFISFAYITFIGAAYKIRKIGQESTIVIPVKKKRKKG